MKRIAKVVAVVATVLIMSGSAHASGERIQNFDSRIVVAKDGSVDVTETIRYDFGSTPRHGIYRYLPVRNKDDKGVQYRPQLTVISVSQDGEAANVEQSNGGSNKILKIGRADTTLTDVHTYVIHYQYKTLVLRHDDGDLLRFNVTGNGWEVPIDSVAATVTGPTGLPQPKLACYTGAVGSSDADCKIEAAAGEITTNYLAPNEGLTVDAQWPPATIINYLMPYKMPLWQTLLILVAGLYVLSGSALLLAALARWLLIRFRQRRARQDQTIVAQYEPPKGLSVGQIGLLSDSKANMVEVTATLIDLAVRGYLRINQTEPAKTFSKAKYSLTKLKPFEGLEPDELALVTAIMDGKDELALSDVDRSAVPAAITSFKKKLFDVLRDRGLYSKKSSSTYAVGGSFVAIFFFAVFIPALWFAVILFSLPLGAYLYNRAGKTLQLTPEGLADWAYVQGFKLFLSVTEKDRLAFTDAPTKTPKLFSKLLPYAVALGVEQQWAKQFEGIDVTKAAGWYSGNNVNAFTAGYLVSDLSNSFASTVSSSMSAPSTTSSGGFGGGSSGGGFGGGGGGSW